MKKLLCVLPFALSLTACVAPAGTGTATGNTGTTGLGMGVTILKAAIVEQCQVTIESRPEWKLVSVAMSADQKQQYESQACGCVADQATQPDAMVGMASAAFDPTARKAIIANAIANSLGTCIGQLKPVK